MMSIGQLQYILIPACAFLGIAAGTLLPRADFARRRAGWIFWLALLVNFALLNLTYLAGGSAWTRVTFAFMMGFFAFAIKLLK